MLATLALIHLIERTWGGWVANAATFVPVISGIGVLAFFERRSRKREAIAHAAAAPRLQTHRSVASAAH
jgi:hypothetical protein